MSCPTSKCLCENLIVSQSVTFAGDTLTINIPAGSYENNHKYCLIIGQEIPTTATITANVVITIGTDTTEYPLVNCDCTNVTACNLSYRKRYSTVVKTGIQSGVFKLLGQAKCCGKCSDGARALPIPAPAAAAETI